MDRVQGKVRAISGRERAGRWEKRAVRKGRGMKRGKKKNNFGRVACLWATLPVFWHRGRTGSQEGGSAYEKSRRELGRGKA